MKLRYRPIQFVADPLREEGRNVAVLGHDGRRVHLRALGLGRDGTVELGYFRAVAGERREEAWVYGEWIAWFRHLAAHEGQQQERLDVLLDALDGRGSPIVARDGGVVDDRENRAPEAVMDDLFKRLVGRPRRPCAHAFDDRVEALLQRTELAFREDFVRDVEVEFAAREGKDPLIVTFPFLLVGEPRAGFKVVRVHSPQKAFVRQVNDALFTFERCAAHGFLRRERCVVLTEPATPAKAVPMRALSAAAHVVDVTRAGAAEEVYRILAA